jgi:hypothetical protein
MRPEDGAVIRINTGMASGFDRSADAPPIGVLTHARNVYTMSAHGCTS